AADSFLGLSPRIAEEAATVPGVEAAAGIRGGRAQIKAGDSFVLGVDPVAAGKAADLEVTEGSLDELGVGTVAVARDQAVNDGVRLGDVLPFTFAASGEQALRVVAVYDKGLTRGGEYLLSQEGFDANFPETSRVDGRVVVVLEDGTDPAAV